ncbi:MAG: hydroxyethylthiazole kinase [Flexilinea sp.]
MCAELLTRIRNKHPLVHHITNFVAMNDTANLTLAFGALPVMAHSKEEVAEMVGASDALVLNPGTLTPEWVESMLIAGRRANEIGIPVVYDPVGVGATKLRNETGQRFLSTLKLAVIRGNPGEVGSLAGIGGAVRGVESVEELKDPGLAARNLSQKYNVVVAITARRDIISDGRRILGVDNGHIFLKSITGSGCMSTAAVAAFCAVENNHLIAAAAALACYGLAAQNAAQYAKGPGTFRAALLDEVYQLTTEDVEANTGIVEL